MKKWQLSKTKLISKLKWTVWLRKFPYIMTHIQNLHLDISYTFLFFGQLLRMMHPAYFDVRVSETSLTNIHFHYFVVFVCFDDRFISTILIWKPASIFCPMICEIKYSIYHILRRETLKFRSTWEKSGVAKNFPLPPVRLEAAMTACAT